MADKPEDKKPKKELSDDIAAKIRAEIIHGSAGYGQPPKDHQFKKGQSGNPRGRPRGSPADLSFSNQPILGAARKAATKKVRMREGDKVKNVSGFEALIESLLTNGVRGNARSAGMVLDLFRTAEQAHAREVREENEFWSAYQAAARAAIAECIAKGEAEPEVLPHPDDIIIDRETGPRFIGPCDWEELKKLQEIERLRDVLIMQDILDQRSRTRLDGSVLKEPGGALLLATACNNELPPRLRLSNTGFVFRQLRCDRLTKRDLTKTLRREWRKLGRNVPRGFVSFDSSVVEKRLRFYYEFVAKAGTGELDIEALANGECNTAARLFFGEHGIALS